MGFKLTKFSLRIRGRLFAGFAAVGAVLAATVGYTVFVVNGVGDTVTLMTTLRAPAAINSTQLVGNLYSTLATLRGYLLTGNPQGKADRAAMWKEMDATIAEFDKLAARFTNPENKRMWAEAKATFGEFHAAQDKAEAIAFTPDAFPATKVLLTEAAPRAETIFGEITKMINEEERLEATADRKRLLKAMADARGNFAAATAQIRMYLLSGDKADKERFARPWENFEKAFSAVTAQRHLLNAAQKASFETAARMHDEFAPLPGKMFAIRESAQWNAPVHVLVAEAAPRAAKILDLLDGTKGADGTRSGGIKGNQQAMLARGSEEVRNEISVMEKAELILLFLGIGAGVLIALLTARSIATPVGSMTDTMGKLAGGDTKVDVMGLGRGDEIGQMAKAVLVFRDAAIEKIRLEREAEEERQRSEAARRKAEEEAIGRERAMVANSIGAGLAKLAAKDLTYRMTDDMPEAYRKLQADFNAALAQMEQAMQSVGSCTQAIHTGSREISSASDDLAQRTEQQAASLEETAAALEQITATVRKASEGANHAHEIVANAKGDAEKSGEVVRKTVEAMGGIEKSSKQISQIIGVINEIAFQTNLLALNAAVEAARAGDSGRGFAVVATEVRALAQRSADAAKEIENLISASTAQVEQGVRLVAEAGTSLERIMSQVVEINSVVSAIASGAKEQATGLDEVNTAMSQMDQVTQQNAAMVEESTAASHSLAHEADGLSQLIGQFQVERKAEAKPANAGGSAGRPAPMLAPRAKAAGARVALAG